MDEPLAWYRMTEATPAATKWTLPAGLLVLQVLLVRSGLREYRRFAPDRTAPADDPGPEAEDYDRWAR